MPRPQNLKAREHILDVACRLFHGRGYRGVSMDDVATAAGLKKANLFHYYQTKEDLGLAVLDRICERYKGKISERFSGPGDPIGVVEKVFADSASDMKENRCCRGCFIGNLAQELSDHNERLRRKISEYLRYWTRQLEFFLERHRAHGYFKKSLDPGQSAEALLSLLEGATLFSKANKQVQALDHARKMAVAYLKGLRI